MSLASKNRTYRVQQIPAYLSIDQVAHFLATASQSIGPAENIRVHSVATTLGFTSYITRRTKTATLTFSQTPAIFENNEEQWVLPSEHDRWNRNLVFDTHFRGFTALNDVPTEEQQLNCIAISGLASHPFGSWKQRGSNSNFMWLRDQLPMDLPFVRSIIYGYDTRLVNSQSFKGINDLALKFIEDLRTLRKSIRGAIVFLAHSLGGIVLKRAVVTIANSGIGEDQLLGRIRMICFFGVPSQGMHIEHLRAMVEGQPNQELIESLSSESKYLPELDIQFSGLAEFRTIRFISVYETKKSLTTREVSPGKWIRSEPYEILVQRSSAIQRGTLQLDSIPVDEDHSNLVKFAENDQAYQNICTRLDEVHSLPLGASDTEHGVAPTDAAAKQEADLECLIDSLSLADTSKRQAEIERAYANTFDWVYENPDLNLISWLRGDGNIFWIRGKPGSGKSTLMKYLHDSEKTSTYIKAWCEQTKIICCWFFFYARGSLIQKSFEGLLHSILHQVVLEEPRISRLILPLYSKRSGVGVLRGAGMRQQDIWPIEDLAAAFDMILRQNVFPLRLCLFLDALDEYEGQPQLVVDFLKSTASRRTDAMTQVKVCFSSRPWNVFVNNFDTYPGFNIHQYTKEDIWRYTESQLVKHYAPQTDLGQSDNSDASDILEYYATQTTPNECIDSQIADLTFAVVEKARGVFLWVRLVLNEFLRSAADGASLDDLHDNLSTMPEELEEFYEMIVQKIPQAYHLESYQIMEIILRSDGELSLDHFAGAVACTPCVTITECMEQLHKSRASEFHQKRFSAYVSPTLPDFLLRSLKLKIESRCGGLVEINRTGRLTVQFMHQTVREFVSKPGFKQRILGNFGRSTAENGHSILTKYYLSAATTQVISGATVSQGMFHARHSESTTGLDQSAFLNSIDAETFYSWVDRELAYVEYRPNTVLALAVIADLRLYVTTELMTRPIRANMHPTMSLLHAVVHHTMVNQEQQSGHPKVNPMDSLGPMCDILLKLGVSLHSEYRRKTPFQWLFAHYWAAILAGNITSPSQAMFDVAQALLDHGQPPDVSIGPGDGLFCKPLHMAQSKLTALLLSHGAPINALDSKGRTALDRSLAHYDLREPLSGITAAEEAADHLAHRSAKKKPSRRADEAFETTMLLVEHGGCATAYGMRVLSVFLSRLEKFYPIPDKFKEIQRLGGYNFGHSPRLQSPTLSSRLSQLSISTPDHPNVAITEVDEAARSRLNQLPTAVGTSSGYMPPGSTAAGKHVRSNTVSGIPDQTNNVGFSTPSWPLLAFDLNDVSNRSSGPVIGFAKAFQKNNSQPQPDGVTYDTGRSENISQRRTECMAEISKPNVPRDYRSFSQPYRLKTSRVSVNDALAGSKEQDVDLDTDAEYLASIRGTPRKLPKQTREPPR